MTLGSPPRDETTSDDGPGAGGPGGRADARRALVRAMPLIPALAALIVGLTGIKGPSYWLDEAATVSATSRSTHDLLRIFDNLDLVHALYYLIMRPWVAVVGTGESAMRLPSVLATAAAAAGVAAIGRRCFGQLAGLLAGLVYAGMVIVTEYAQEARSYAMVTAAAVLATYLLVRATSEGVSRRWRRFAGYGLTVVLLALLNLDGVLLVPAHAITLWATRSKPAGTWPRWLVSAGAACAALIPFVIAARSQKIQVDWLPHPTWDTVWTLLKFMAGGPNLLIPMFALAALGVVAGRMSRGAPSLAAVAVPWLVVPPAVLLIGSVVTEPMFMYRYVLFVLPGLALLAGAGLARLAALGRSAGRPVGVTGGVALAVAVTLLVVLTVPRQVDIRRQNSRLDDLRAAADVIRANAHDGDSIVYLAGVVRWAAAAYPDAFGRLKDVALSESPVKAGNLKGRDRLPREMRGPLLAANRVWVMNSRSILPQRSEMAMRRWEVVRNTGPWRVVGVWHYRGGTLTLYQRVSPAQRNHAKPAQPPHGKKGQRTSR
jgi:mannosyltransferase